jgi:hypothetical protein
MNIFKLERILNHQHELHFNVPYDDNQASLWATERKLDKAREETEEWERKYHELEEKFKNFFDIPIQTDLGEKFPWSGYVDMDGQIYRCESCEHEKIIRQIVLKDYLDQYLSVPASFYDHKPQGTFQEEYFAMKYLGFAKVSSFRDAPTKKILFRYDKLTWKQSDVIYPR